MKRKSPIRHKVRDHNRKGKIVHSYYRGRGFVPRLKHHYTVLSHGRLGTDDYQRKVLLRLFNKQDTLIEHKFPTSGVSEYTISCAGDIYREMTRRHPHYPYIDEKWGSLSKYISLPRGFTEGDFEELKKELQAKNYKDRRDQYLKNLRKLELATKQADIDAKRKKIMLASLNMIRGTIRYIESGNPYRNPRKEYDALTEEISTYFPKEFWKE